MKMTEGPEIPEPLFYPTHDGQVRLADIEEEPHEGGYLSKPPPLEPRMELRVERQAGFVSSIAFEVIDRTGGARRAVRGTAHGDVDHFVLKLRKLLDVIE